MAAPVTASDLVNQADILALWAPMRLLDDHEPDAFADDDNSSDLSTPEGLAKAAQLDAPRLKNGKIALPAKVRIGGILSTEAPDLQGDIVIQNGLDCRYFLRKGWLTHEHDRGPGAIVGYPDKTWLTTDNGVPATGFEGHLLIDDEHPMAAGIYRTMAALRKGGDERRIGISVEGPPPMRNPNNRRQILKSMPMQAGLCNHPMSMESRVGLLKAMGLADIGYQTPAHGGGSLAALVPQGLGNLTPEQKALHAERAKRSISADELSDMLCKAYPGLTPEKARITAIHLCNMCPAQRH